MLIEAIDDKESEEEKVEFELLKSGAMILVSSFEIEKQEVVPLYYMRQTVEKLIGATWSAGAYSLPDSDVSLENLAETGADWIALIVTCYQADLASLRIAANETTPTDAGLIHVVQQAHDLGLRVMLKPHLDLSRDISHWRGEIGREYTDRSAVGRVVHLLPNFHRTLRRPGRGPRRGSILRGDRARGHDPPGGRLAEHRGGGPGPLRRPDHLRRQPRRGRSAIDLVGRGGLHRRRCLLPVDGPDQPDPGRAHGRLAAQDRRPGRAGGQVAKTGHPDGDRLQEHRRRRHPPLDYLITGRIDLQEQSECHRAAFDSVFGQPWFAGIYWWAWSPDPRRGGPTDDDYTPHGKPAEAVIRNWYGGRTDGPGEDRDRRQPPRPSVKDKSGRGS